MRSQVEVVDATGHVRLTAGIGFAVLPAFPLWGPSTLPAGIQPGTFPVSVLLDGAPLEVGGPHFHLTSFSRFELIGTPGDLWRIVVVERPGEWFEPGALLRRTLAGSVVTLSTEEPAPHGSPPADIEHGFSIRGARSWSAHLLSTVDDATVRLWLGDPRPPSGTYSWWDSAEDFTVPSSGERLTFSRDVLDDYGRVYLQQIAGTGVVSCSFDRVFEVG
jgi:hypothetical protein